MTRPMAQQGFIQSAKHTVQPASRQVFLIAPAINTLPIVKERTKERKSMASAVTHFSRKPAVKGRFGGISDSTIHNWVRAELITKPIRLGPNTVCWLDAEIDAISAARVAGKTDAEIRQLVRQLHAQRELVGA